MSTVVKPFTTVNRRFAPGADVSAEDVAPRTLEELAASGFVTSETSPAAASAAKPPLARVTGRRPR